MTHVITIGNFKGGVGKTTTCTMLAYILQREHKKTLLVDFDPQANASAIIAKTFDVDPKSADESLFDALNGQDLSPSVVKCNDYLDLVPSDWNLAQLSAILSHFYESDQSLVLKSALSKIEDNYDFVIIDTPPTISDYTNNALACCDYFLIIMQTQEQSFTSSMKFINYALKFREDNGFHYDLLGILPYLVDKKGSVDKKIISKAKDEYDNAVLKTTVYNRQRIKKYGLNGIKPVRKDWDSWDEDVLNMYYYLYEELIGRIKIYDNERKKG